MNNSNLQIGPFKIFINLTEGINISKDDGTLKLIPSNSNDAVNLMICVMGVESIKALPSKLNSGVYQAKFQKGRKIEILNTMYPDIKGIVISFIEGDDLILAIKTGIRNFIDSTTLQGPPRSTAYFPVKEVAQEGR